MQKTQFDWMNYKYSMVFQKPLYELATFGKKDMRATFPLSDKGLCLINVGIGKGEISEKYLQAVAIIDTGAERTFINTELSHKLQLELSDSTVEVNGFDKEISHYSLINFINREMNFRIPVYVTLVTNTPIGVDLILGADFLEGFIFTRNAVDKKFILEM